MSLFNGTFSTTVKNQLALRQSAKSATANANNSLLVYNNAKTAWARLTSSVNTTNNMVSSSRLAGAYVLEAGTLHNNGSSSALRAGLGSPDPRNRNVVGGAYGDLGGLSNGIIPMPGITSIRVSNRGEMGSLRQASISFTCWNLNQLNSLEKLYMRPGYSALIEWGTTMYLDNNSKNLVSNKFRIDIINDNRASYQSILSSIKATREKSSGNYDALFGLVNQFNWVDREDGGFDCIVEIISMGTLLESMKINYTAIASTAPSNGASKLYFGSVIGEVSRKQLDRMYHKGKIIGLFRELLSPNYISKHYELNEIGKKYHDRIHQVRHIHFTQNDYIDSKTNDVNSTKLGTFYLDLETIVEIINEFVLLRNSKDGGIITSISTKDKSGNDIRCLSNKMQTSINAYNCIVHDRVTEHTITYNVDGTDRNVVIKRPKLTGGKVASPLKYYYDEDYNTGVIGNIYVGIEYFLHQILLNTNEDGKIDVYKALKLLLNEIKTALCGINNFDILIDPDDNVGRIVDINYIETNRTKVSKFSFKTTGLGSIVRKRKMESAIFPEASTMISIAATAANPNNTMSLDVDSLIKFNQGLTDRIFPAKITPDSDRTLKNEEQKSVVEQVTRIFDELNKYSSFMSSSLAESNLSEMRAIMESLTSGYPGILTLLKKTSTDSRKKINNFIIPIKLSLTIDGISGITIGEIFVVNPNEMPESYVNSNVGFIVTRLTEVIENNDWYTVIETQTCILD